MRLGVLFFVPCAGRCSTVLFQVTGHVTWGVDGCPDCFFAVCGRFQCLLLEVIGFCLCVGLVDLCLVNLSNMLGRFSEFHGFERRLGLTNFRLHRIRWLSNGVRWTLTVIPCVLQWLFLFTVRETRSFILRRLGARRCNEGEDLRFIKSNESGDNFYEVRFFRLYGVFRRSGISRISDLSFFYHHVLGQGVQNLRVTFFVIHVGFWEFVLLAKDRRLACRPTGRVVLREGFFNKLPSCVLALRVRCVRYFVVSGGGFPFNVWTSGQLVGAIGGNFGRFFYEGGVDRYAIAVLYRFLDRTIGAVQGFPRLFMSSRVRSLFVVVVNCFRSAADRFFCQPVGEAK